MSIHETIRLFTPVELPRVFALCQDCCHVTEFKTEDECERAHLGETDCPLCGGELCAGRCCVTQTGEIVPDGTSLALRDATGCP